jgi:Ca-activated chloride channel homolog
MLSRRTLLTLLAPAAAGAQVTIEPRKKASASEPQRPDLRVDTSLVLVPVTVCDPLNRPITGLEKENFRLLDDSVEQSVTHFAMEDEPVAVGLIFDISGSMADKLRRSRQAAAEFFRVANPEDEFFLIEFDSSPKITVPLTRNTGEIQNRLTFNKTKGSTALIDAVVLGLNEVKKSEKTRKALLVISDGGDNNSRYSETELRNMVRESYALIYAIGIFGDASSREEYSGPATLASMSEQSGGHALAGPSFELPDIAAKIGIELRNRYILGFSPTNRQRDGRYHSLQVKVIAPRGMPPLHGFWRRGYYAPLD